MPQRRRQEAFKSHPRRTGSTTAAGEEATRRATWRRHATARALAPIESTTTASVTLPEGAQNNTITHGAAVLNAKRVWQERKRPARRSVCIANFFRSFNRPLIKTRKLAVI
jgi:hypothetical protein